MSINRISALDHLSCYYFRLATVYRLPCVTVYRWLPFTVGYRLPYPTVTVYRLPFVTVYRFLPFTTITVYRVLAISVRITTVDSYMDENIIEL